MLSAADATRFERCMAVGGFAVFPADTVYGLACDPDAKEAVQRIGLLKRRPLDEAERGDVLRPRSRADALPELGPRTTAALAALLPGAVTLVVGNPQGRYPLAGGDAPGSLGVRVPALAGPAAALRSVRWPVLQTSANRAGGPDPRTLAAVPAGLRAAADLLLDAGPLPGTPSTVVDLRSFEADGTWSLLREGAVARAAIADAL